MENLVEKLKLEHEDLCKKIDSLEELFQSDVFKDIKTYHKNLLTMQHIAMCAYCNCLAQRILDLNGDNKHAKS